ncbi:leucine carboxyl methyltransferase 1-like protein [Dermatophagoides farinae]|uniref:tRNA wybutosine-synthesizing protein 4 n=2 Tax=Dermatophagoides farinae TaxID=6954 RepID=A0A9D4SKK6_DERFA|nr:tRNA wybutosine-synthesizing protein 4-like [Dermatophagoides farinae]KAH7645232.1 leucine carboxyl methyltransferase 1-like protein [Dermatophagoides farinae]
MDQIDEKKNKKNDLTKIKSITGTNDFSTLSKYSMINKGYCCDPYLKYFIDGDSTTIIKTRAPIIHHGYYVRFKAIEYGWQKVFEYSMNEQQINIILSLGAGFDTSSFRYRSDRNIFIEIDHPDVCQRKANIIRMNQLIDDKKINFEENCPELFLQSSRYLLFGVDLRQHSQVINLLSTNLLDDMINDAATDSNEMKRLNFILFNECSLCYIEQTVADKLMAKIIGFIETKYSSSRYSIQIQYLGYEMYNANVDSNDFNRFMFKHFQQMNAPILTFINENQIRKRFENLNFNQINLINMRHFYRELLTQEDRNRINHRIEPFDEWEELENVCQVYCLTICKKFKSNQLSNQTITIYDHRPVKSLLAKSFHPSLQVFGHCSNYDAHNNQINVFGGFGIEPPPPRQSSVKMNNRVAHSRFKNILQLSLDDSHEQITNVQIIHSKNNESIINRLHSRVVPFNDGKHFFLSGGRKSPNQPLLSSIIAIDYDINQFEIIESFDIVHKYRHVCSRFGYRDQLCQFGGLPLIQSNNNVDESNSIWMFDMATSRWFQSKINGLLTDRHSLAFTTFGNHSIVLNGGLDCHHNQFLSENHIELMDSRMENVEKFLIADLSEKLYSHHMKIIDDHRILIIGGIADYGISNRIYQIDFRLMKILTTNYIGTNDDDQILMMHNFSCELINKNYLWTIGGGGNCFSFGTHFNPILSFQID